VAAGLDDLFDASSSPLDRKLLRPTGGSRKVRETSSSAFLVLAANEKTTALIIIISSLKRS